MPIELQIESKLRLLRIVQKAGVHEEARRLNQEIINLYILHAIFKKEGTK